VVYALMAFAIVTGAIMVRMEDDELERRFGGPYRQYREITPAVIPRVVARSVDRTKNALRANSQERF
jgi:protein-S-isoprenylcysteine O-methyltransferase Ste14